MEILHTVAELRARLNTEPNVAFVPTMGNLHAGHLHLVDIAKQHAPCVVVSIFVNPLQFGANEDLANYPRTLQADCEKLQAAGTHIVFAPSVTEMYPDADVSANTLGQTMMLIAPPVANTLCGANRPGHFDGVATVVMKLFNIVMPQFAVFGKKDFQQLFIIRELVRQFNLPIQILAGATVRETNGLAMSSRNGYLSAVQKSEAALLQQTLQHIVNEVQAGNTDFVKLEQSAKKTLSHQGWSVDYISICSAITLHTACIQDMQLVVLAAAKLGGTRLIDNIEFHAKNRHE